MKENTSTNLSTVFRQHLAWLRGQGGEKADLRRANLRDAQLSHANLRFGDLREANLVDAELSKADLRYADLSKADLSGANLSHALLVGTNLSHAVLVSTKLSDANLTGALLVGTKLHANLRGANLTNANLTNADLRGARLRGAKLRGAKLGDGLSWEQYTKELVPSLLTAGGKSLDEVLRTGCWDCHSWDNCPMHAAFGARNIQEIPLLYREEADRFIQFFDAGLIPEPQVPRPSADVAATRNGTEAVEEE